MIPALLLWVAMGQQPCVGGAPPKNPPDCIPAEQYIKQQMNSSGGSGSVSPGILRTVKIPDPITCPKYEHREEGFDSRAEYKQWCAPDMHTVTEKEWAALMQRLERLESGTSATCVQDGAKMECTGNIKLLNKTETAPKP